MKQTIFYVFFLFYLSSQFALSYAGDKKASPRKMIKAPVFYGLATANSNGILKMECEGQEPNYTTIDCVFTHAIISKKTEAVLAEEREKRNQEYSKITNKHIDDMKKEMSKLNITKERRILLDSLTPEKKKHSDKIFAMSKDIGGSKNKDEIIRATEAFSKFFDQCCNIRISTWKERFERVSQLKWISNPGPQGLCNVVRIKTLETVDDYYLLWKFTEITVSADSDKKRNDIFDKACADIEINKPITYSWDIPTDLIMDCQCVQYGS